MKSFIEVIYIDSDNQARQTGLREERESNAITLARFRSYRCFGVDFPAARFLLDYHDAKGDLSYTIPINDEGFRFVTGLVPKTDAEYRQIDADFWGEARATNNKEQ